jgi:hypothetical protein
MTKDTPSPEKTRREKRLGEALRANLKRRKTAARKAGPEAPEAEKPGDNQPETSVGHMPGEDLPGDERG